MFLGFNLPRVHHETIRRSRSLNIQCLVLYEAQPLLVKDCLSSRSQNLQYNDFLLRSVCVLNEVPL